MTDQTPFAQWAIVELLGHRRVAGYVREQEIAGQTFLRIDRPGRAGEASTQYYSPQAVYAITPVSEDTARATETASVAPPLAIWDARSYLRLVDEERTREHSESGTRGLPAGDEAEVDDAGPGF